MCLGDRLGEPSDFAELHGMVSSDPGLAKSLFDLAFEALVAREGGLLEDPRGLGEEIDAGDLTFETTPRRPAPLHRRLSPVAARRLYFDECWTPALCDHLPPAVALEVFDMAASSGPKAAVRALKAALRLDPDAWPGVELLKAVRLADPVRLRARFMAARLSDIAGHVGGAHR
ncbi:MAG: glycosyl hydrolase 108 family protein [Phenylobacterium sp.]